MMSSSIGPPVSGTYCSVRYSCCDPPLPGQAESVDWGKLLSEGLDVDSHQFKAGDSDEVGSAGGEFRTRLRIEQGSQN